LPVNDSARWGGGQKSRHIKVTTEQRFSISNSNLAI
jgi:hypothetical protein